MKFRPFSLGLALLVCAVGYIVLSQAPPAIPLPPPRTNRPAVPIPARQFPTNRPALAPKPGAAAATNAAETVGETNAATPKAITATATNAAEARPAAPTPAPATPSVSGLRPREAVAPVAPAEEKPAAPGPLPIPGRPVQLTPPADAPPGGVPTAAVPGGVAPAGAGEKKIEINFNKAEVDQVLDFYANLTGRTVLRPAALPGTITIKTQSGLSRTEAIQALDSVLALNAVTMIPVAEKFVKAVPQAQALMEGAAFTHTKPGDLPEADQFVTQIVRLTNALPSEVVPAIQPFAKNPAGIVAVETSRMLVLRDYAANVKRMMEVIAKVDVIPELDYKLEIIPIKFGRVEEIYSTMSSLIGGGGGGGSIAAGGAARTANRTTGNRNSRTTGNQMTRPGQTQTTAQNQAAMPNQSSFQQRLQSIVNRAAVGEAQLLGDAKIVPDERSNTLIVFANKQDMEMITNIVAKVDVLLAQVLIEAIVLDVSLGKSQELGVSAIQNPKQSGNWTRGGAMNNIPFLNLVTNYNSSSVPAGFSYFGQYKDDMAVIVRALAQNNKAEVLQTPRIQTSHAVPANFFNGRTVPYITSTSYGGFGGYGPSSSYQQLEVGVQLDVTPYITPDGLVVMEVTQTIDEISGSTHIENVGDIPNTTRRTATSTVSVNTGDTIMLGGFIRTNKERNRSGVPLLKDIPLLGYLFRTSTDKNDRSELIILLRPTVLLKPQDAAQMAKSELANLPGVQEMKKTFEEDEAKNKKKRAKASSSKSSTVVP